MRCLRELETREEARVVCIEMGGYTRDGPYMKCYNIIMKAKAWCREPLIELMTCVRTIDVRVSEKNEARSCRRDMTSCSSIVFVQESKMEVNTSPI